MAALLIGLAIMAIMTGLGRPLVRTLGPALTPLEQWLAAPLAGAMPLAAAVWAVGSWRYSWGSMVAVLTVAAILAVAALAGDRPLRRPGLPSAAAARALGVAALVLLVVAAVGAFAPPSDHDTMRYHLTLPRRDLELGRIAVHFGWSVYEFFPPLADLLTHLAYATGGAAAAQLLNVCWTALAAAWAGALALRLGGCPTAAALAALLFLSQRVVINLAAAVTVDIALAAYLTAAAVVGLALVEEPRRSGMRLGLLLGVLVGAALNIKYQAGIAAAALMAVLLAATLARRLPVAPLLAAGAVAAALIVPLLWRNWLVTGNPVFPIFHQLFGPDNLDIFSAYAQTVAGREPPTGGLAALPWTMFVRQGDFDGLQFGFPLALVAIPFAFAERRALRLCCLALWALYVLAWWTVMPHLLRFQLPLLGVVAALTALGLQRVEAASAGMRWAGAAFAAFAATAGLTQMLFLGSTALHRWPGALGLVTVEQMLEGKEFVYYSLVSPCRWVEARLEVGERYLALVNDPSWYCPQAAALPQVEPGEAAGYYRRTHLPPVSAVALARRLEEENVRYVVVAANLGADDDPLVFAKHRYDALLAPVLAHAIPLLKAPSGSVYDGREVAAALRALGD
jgi:hypothetical protein